MTANARLFLALWLPEALCAPVAERQLAWTWPPTARLQAPERWHLTLHFIGNVPEVRLPEVSRGLAVPFEPFSLELTRFDLWPGGIAVLRPAALPRQLLDLHERLSQALRALGLPVEARAFRPHLTLARKAAGAVRPLQAPPPLRWDVADGYRLVRTRPAGDYQPVTLYRA